MRPFTVTGQTFLIYYYFVISDGEKQIIILQWIVLSLILPDSQTRSAEKIRALNYGLLNFMMILGDPMLQWVGDPWCHHNFARYNKCWIHRIVYAGVLLNLRFSGNVCFPHGIPTELFLAEHQGQILPGRPLPAPFVFPEGLQPVLDWKNGQASVFHYSLHLTPTQ